MVVQTAMGWDDSHLHEFRIGQERLGKPDRSDRFMSPPADDKEHSAYLFMVLGKAGTKAIYTYGFGDSWEHVSMAEKVLPPELDVAYPICVGSKLQGPPEDCGGVPGYYNLLEPIHDPQHPEHEDRLDWVGGEFNPEAFSVEDTNQRLAPLQLWWAKMRK